MNTIGLPKMSTSAGYARDFSPDFVSWLSELTKNQILIEENYGSDLGYQLDKYKPIKNLRIWLRPDIFSNSDTVISITCPQNSDLELMKSNSLLVAMLHLDTHPTRKTLLLQKNIKTASLDNLKDDDNCRLVQDYYHTARNAVTEGFIQLRRVMGDDYWFNPKRKPISVYLLGFGKLGQEVAATSLKMGNTSFQQELIQKNGNPLVNLVPTDHLHSKYQYYKNLFKSDKDDAEEFPNMVIDATKRTDFSKAILTKKEIGLLPEKCVIVDISADCYQEEDSIVKGIQGIPTGNESKYIFLPNDPAWEDTSLIPKKYQLPKELRRVVVSHYAWPSYGTNLNRITNMQKYEKQLKSVIVDVLKMNQ